MPWKTLSLLNVRQRLVEGFPTFASLAVFARKICAFSIPET
jgi:hypothetical protein